MPKSTKNGYFWPRTKTFCAPSFLNEFQKFQRIWDLWGMPHLCSQLVKTWKIWPTLITTCEVDDVLSASEMVAFILGSRRVNLHDFLKVLTRYLRFFWTIPFIGSSVDYGKREDRSNDEQLTMTEYLWTCQKHDQNRARNLSNRMWQKQRTQVP